MCEAGLPPRGGTGLGLTILLVDDDPFMHRMLVPRLAELTGAPASVLTALTPDAALARLDEAPDGKLVVLSDFNLKAPMNGLQLLGVVREKRPEALRVLFSGYSAEQIGDVSGDGAAQAFLEKPMRIDDMVPPLRALISGMA